MRVKIMNLIRAISKFFSRHKDEGTLWFWTSPDVTDDVRFGSRFRITQDNGEVTIIHDEWTTTISLPQTPKLYHICYHWDVDWHSLFIEGRE